MNTAVRTNIVKNNISKTNSLVKNTTGKTSGLVRSDTNPIDKSFLQNYSTTTVIYIIGFLAFVLGCVYLYNYYKAFKAKLMATQAQLVTNCPDYWESVGDKVCKNVNFLGSCANTTLSNTVDFSGEIFTNSNTGDYAKCKWAKECNMPWSGIDRIC